MKITNKNALLFVILAAILWSTGGIMIKNVDESPLVISGVRSGIAACIMFLYLRKPIKNISFTQVVGAAMYALMVVLYVFAVKLTSPANAILLQFTAPIWVVILAKLFLKEEIKKSDYLTIFCVFAGMTLFFIEGLRFDKVIGNIVAILSGVALASVTILLKMNKSDNAAVEMTLLGNVLTFIVCLPFIIKSPPTLSSMAYLTPLGVFQLGTAYIFYALAIQHVPAVQAILITVIEPLLNPVWVFIFSGEIPSFYVIFGGIIVLTTIVARELYNSSKKKQTLSSLNTEH